MRFGFYISGKSRRLTNFLEQAESTVISDIGIVFSDSFIEENLTYLLKKKTIEIVQIDYKNLPSDSRTEKNQLLSDILLAVLRENGIDYCISFGTHILSGLLLDEYKYRIINFHPAILPMFPGLKAIDQAVEHGNVMLVGNTAHFIDSGVDTGPIIMQSVTTMQNFLKDRDYDVILDMQIPMLNKIIRAIMNGELTVNNGRANIENADYSVTHIYPEY